MFSSRYNISESRRLYLEPMLDRAELEELAALELDCFPAGENYDLDTLTRFVSRNGAGILRWHEPAEPAEGADRQLIAFHLFDCFAAELITLDVHPGHRRRGIGTALVTESLRKLREFGHTHVTCQIATSNEGSLELHYRLGFKPIGTLPDYYGRGRDAQLLVAALQGP